MDAVSSGRRVSLVAWILSKEAEPQSSPFWDDAQSTHEHVLVDAGRARMAGRNFPRELELHTLMILGNVVMRQGNWSRLLELSAAQVNLSQQIHGRSGVLDDTVSVLFPARPATYHVRVTNLTMDPFCMTLGAACQGEILGTALLRFSVAARHLAQDDSLPERTAEQARAGCDRATRLMANREAAVKCRRDWDEYLGSDRMSEEGLA